MKKQCIIGIDTSNYTTSVAACDLQAGIISDRRTILTVKPGERGLRQSEALFQHIQNLPSLIQSLMADLGQDADVLAMAASARPRPVEGSYMPVFGAGLNLGASLASVMRIPLYTYSHQEGHIRAAIYGNVAPNDQGNRQSQGNASFLAFHLSGGTTELLEVVPHDIGYDIHIIGGTKDISIGQLVDRVGVGMGIGFPCGKEMDRLANEFQVLTENAKVDTSKPSVLAGVKPIHIEDTWLNLSGIESQCQRIITNTKHDKENALEDFQQRLSYELFSKVKKALHTLVKNAQAETGIQDVLYIGGVSDSQFMGLNKRSIKGLGTDNAVGIALLGLEAYAAR